VYAHRLIHELTSTSVLRILRRKCLAVASRVAPWWVTLSMRRRNRQTDGRTPDRYTTLSARRSQRNNNTINADTHWPTLTADKMGHLIVKAFHTRYRALGADPGVQAVRGIFRESHSRFYIVAKQTLSGKVWCRSVQHILR